MSAGGLPGAVASEWTKLWSVRSTYWCLVAAVFLMGSSVAINGFSIASQHERGIADSLSRTVTQLPTETVIYLVQFALSAMAALMIGSEYAHGSMRSTLQWVPIRWRVPVAKSAVVAPVLFVVGTLLALLGVWLAEVTLDSAAMPYTTADVMETAFLIGLYLALLGMMTIGIGTAVRGIAGTLVILFMLLMVVPIVLRASGSDLLRDLSHFIPGIAVLAAWAIAALALGIRRLRKDDA
ncbi:MAG: ABC transporter permease [Actinomycetota bacterium]|nr:ABC transporter permease [Actinomycetota bacterium]